MYTPSNLNLFSIAKKALTTSKPAANKPKTGLDMMDKLLLGATKLGIFTLLGVFLAANLQPKPAPVPAPKRKVP
jgi:hypothetical protein